jgi:hypothetical protein
MKFYFSARQIGYATTGWIHVTQVLGCPRPLLQLVALNN